jgi:xylulokinase
MPDLQHFIGIDVGSTFVKAALFAADGTLQAQWSRQYPTERPGPGLVEQDPSHWLEGVRDAIDGLLFERDPASIAAIGLCSQVNTDVFIDAAGTALVPAISWQDVRAAREAAELDATITAEEKRAWWGAPMPIGASHVLAKMKWMAHQRPDVWQRTVRVLSPKDYCLLHLAGVTVADPIASFGQTGLNHAYIEPLIARVPGADTRLAPLHSFIEPIGQIKLGSSGRSAPVVAGTMDAWASLFGCGVSRPGQGMYVSGTSEILALAGDRRIGADGIVTFPTVDGLVVNAGPTQAGGDSVRWLAGILGCDPLDVLGLAERADRHGRPILFVPHLEGERAPLWDSELRGAFVGLDSRAAAPDLALAALEGVALSAEMLLASLERAAGFRPDALYYGGGGARSDFWSQIRADCLGVALHRCVVTDTGCLGAAIMAAVGVGAFKGIAEAAPVMTRVQRTFAPNPKMTARYDVLREAYRNAIPVLRPIGRFHARPPLAGPEASV